MFERLVSRPGFAGAKRRACAPSRSRNGGASALALLSAMAMAITAPAGAQMIVSGGGEGGRSSYDGADSGAGGGGGGFGGGGGGNPPGQPGTESAGGAGSGAGAGSGGAGGGIVFGPSLSQSYFGSAGGPQGGALTGGGGGGTGLILGGSADTNNQTIQGGGGGQAVWNIAGGGGGGGGGLLVRADLTATISGSQVSGGNGADGGGIGGGGGAGAFLISGGAINNVSGSISGGGGGAGLQAGAGGAGVLANRGRIDNSGAISGGAGGDANSSTGSSVSRQGGGAGGNGVEAWGSAIANAASGSITGGHGGRTGFGSGSAGGNGGHGILFRSGASGNLINHGTIRGGKGGYSFDFPGSGGAGVAGADLTIVNNGSITGGMNDAGTVQADAITFTGGTNRLTIGLNGTFSGDIAINGQGSLTLDQSDNDATIAVAITGDGSLTKTGSATVTLTGTNTYTGGTMISQGVLAIDGNQPLGTGTVTLDGGSLRMAGCGCTTPLANGFVVNASGGTLDAGSGELAIAGDIRDGDGRGRLTITGDGGPTGGYVVFAGNSSHSGPTHITANGILLAGSATGLSPNSDYIVDGILDPGGFDATLGSLSGAASGRIGSSGAGPVTLTIAMSGTGSFDGVILDGGPGSVSLTKTGTGTLTLNGNNTYTGATRVQAGKLVVNGSVVGSVALDGGSLGGSGTVGGVSVGRGATVAPGNSIGTLTINGNVAFAAGSTYQVEVNAAGQGDKIVASGVATLSGGTVQVLAENGNYAEATRYVILTANGGVTGRFGTVTSSLVFLEPSLAYDSQNVVLTMTRTATSFGPDGGGSSGGHVAATRNQGFIAVAAERLGVGNPVYDTLLSSTASEARAGFDLLSGEAHAQAVAVMIDESRLVRETILGRLRGPLLTAPSGQVAASFSADLPGRKGTVLVNAPLPQPRYAFWGEAFGGQGNTSADGNAAGLSRRGGGALLGADVLLYDNPGSSLRVGVAGGYSQSRFDLDARLSSGRLESGHAALYAGARFGSLRFDVGAAYSWSESDIRRQVQIRGFGDLLHSQRPGAVAQAFAEFGYGFAFQGFALEPFAQLALIRVSTDGSSEQGGAAALRLFSSEQLLGFTTLGLRAEAQLGAMPLFARAMLGWRHGFGELTPQATTAFATGTNPAQVFAAKLDREALVAEAGLDWRLSSTANLGLTYSAAIGERSRDHALKGRVEMRF